MADSFRPYSLDQADLLPQAPRDWLPEGHLAFFLEETVSLLDLRPIFERYQGSGTKGGGALGPTIHRCS